MFDVSESTVKELTRKELIARVREFEDDVEDIREFSGKRGADINRRMSKIEQQLEDLQSTSDFNIGAQVSILNRSILS